MTILVLTEGGRETGFGHLSRCVALTQYIARFNKTKTRFVVNGDKTASDFLRRQDIKSIILSDWTKEKNKVARLTKESNAVIIDSYLAPKSLYYFLYHIIDRSKGKLICIDDCNRIDYPTSIVLNPSIYGDKLKYKINSKSTYLLGPNNAVLRKEFWCIPEKTIRKKVSDVLLTFGGTEFADFTKKLIGFLSKKYPQFICNFILPEANLSARDIIRLMLKCDVCISSGGQTIYELARIGLPTIGICVVENQRLNLEAWEGKGFVEYIGWYKNSDIFNRLERRIEKLLPYKERLRRSKIGRDLISAGWKDWFEIFKATGRS